MANMTDANADDWTRAGPYELVHLDDWRITSVIIQGKSRHMLWHGTRQIGHYASGDAVMAFHKRLQKQAGGTDA